MTRTFRILGLAAALALSVTGASFAAGHSVSSETTTQTGLGGGAQNPMVARPATGSPGQSRATHAYGTNGSSGQYNNAVNSPARPDSAHPSAASPSGGDSR